MAFGSRSLDVGRVLQAGLAALASLALQCILMIMMSCFLLLRSVSSLIEVVLLRIFVHNASQTPPKKSGVGAVELPRAKLLKMRSSLGCRRKTWKRRHVNGDAIL